MFGMILMGILVISFAIWGIADIFRGYGQQTVVTVGDIEVGPGGYAEIQREVINEMSQQAHKQLSLQQARAKGLNSQVMQRVIAGAAVDNHARDLGLGLSQKELLHEITQQKEFQNSSGKFSAAIFQEAVRSMDMTEKSFLTIQRQRNLRRQVLNALTSAISAPKMLVHALDTYNNETRRLRYILVPTSAVAPSAEPTEAQLKSYYDNHKATFTVPEFRKVGYFAVTPQTVKSKVKISEDELKREFNAEKAKYAKPAKRHILQISFPSFKAANAAYEKIQSGTSFTDIAKEQGFKPSDIDLGTLTRQGMADPVLSKTAFALKKGEVSKPVKGALGAIALLKVTDIVAGKQTTFAEAKPKVEEMLLRERAQGAILNLHDKIEDQRASGLTLSEVAAKLKIPYHTVDAVDRQGKDADGKEVALPDKKKLLEAVYASDTGVDNDPLDNGQKGYIWYDVLAVTPQRVKPLAAVKDKVIKLWKEDNRQSRLAKYTDKLMNEIKSGKKTFEEVAQEVHVPLQPSALFRRSGMALNVLPPAVSQAFALPLGGYGSAPSGVNGARILFQVTKVNPPPKLSEPDRKQLEDRLQLFVSDDILSEYFAALEKRYKVEVNQEAVARLAGNQDQDLP